MGEAGSLVVEFAMMAVVLLVPLAWAGLSLQQLSAAKQAAQAAAGDAVAAFLQSPDDGTAMLRGRAAAELSLAPYSDVVRETSVTWSCSRSPCLRPGARVTAVVDIEAVAPAIPVLGARPSAHFRAEQAGVVDAFAYPK